MNENTIFTIGHSTHPIEYLIDLFKKHGVNCVIDVRTVASSSYNPQYNQYPMQLKLKEAGIQYLHFAEEFGARRLDPDLWDEDGKVSFEKVRSTWAFKHGVERLWQGIQKGFLPALLCSEAEPLECHRFSMICPALIEDGFEVLHILKDGALMSNAELEKVMLEQLDDKLPKEDIFNPEIPAEVKLAEAYKIISKQVSYDAGKMSKKTGYDD